MHLRHGAIPLSVSDLDELPFAIDVKFGQLIHSWNSIFRHLCRQPDHIRHT
jgi:hypothetical protein